MQTAPQSLVANDGPRSEPGRAAGTARDGIRLTLSAIAAVVVLASGIGRTDFVPPDEARVSEISREMTVAPTRTIPMLNGEPFLEEPPLFYWMQAAVFDAAGAASTALARVPSVAAAVAGVLATAALARVLGSSAALTVLVLATAPEYWWMARSATPDTTAAAAATAGLAAFFLAWRSGSRTWAAASVLAFGLAFWAKSLLPTGLIGATIASFLLWSGRGRLSWWALALMSAAVAGAAALWIGIVAHELGRDAVVFFLVKNHLHRLTGAGEGHVRSIFYYVANVLLGFLPWSVALPAAGLAAWRERSRPERRFVLVWATSMVVLLSVSATKRAHYLLAAYPALATLVAQWWVDPWHGRRDRVSRGAVVVAAAIVPPLMTLVLLGMDVPRVAGVSARERADAIASGLADALLHEPPAWAGAAVFAALGVALIVAARRGGWRTVAATMGVQLVAVHLLLTLIVLPRFDPYTSARTWGVRLGRLQSAGAQVVAFGFRGSETLAPFMFYAQRRFPAFDDVDGVVRAVADAPTCLFVPAKDADSILPALGDRMRLAERGTVGGAQLMLFESQPQLCRTAANARD